MPISCQQGFHNLLPVIVKMSKCNACDYYMLITRSLFSVVVFCSHRPTLSPTLILTQIPVSSFSSLPDSKEPGLLNGKCFSCIFGDVDGPSLKPSRCFLLTSLGCLPLKLIQHNITLRLNGLYSDQVLLEIRKHYRSNGFFRVRVHLIKLYCYLFYCINDFIFAL